MSLNGTQRPHGKTIGYIVVGKIGPGIECYGVQDTDHHVLLIGQPVTLFGARAEAKRAVCDSEIECPYENYQILRVARRIEKP